MIAIAEGERFGVSRRLDLGYRRIGDNQSDPSKVLWYRVRRSTQGGVLGWYCSSLDPSGAPTHTARVRSAWLLFEGVRRTRQLMQQHQPPRSRVSLTTATHLWEKIVLWNWRSATGVQRHGASGVDAGVDSRGDAIVLWDSVGADAHSYGIFALIYHPALTG